MAGISYVSMPSPTAREEDFNDGQLKITAAYDIKPELDSHSDYSSSTQSTEVSDLKKYNKQLEEENQSLKVEMENFEQKLSYLEYALGAIDGDSIDDGASFINSQHSCVGGVTIPTTTNPDDTDVSKDKNTAISDEVVDHPNEIERLQKKNKDMLKAIKALAKAALSQKEKHELYKSKSNVAKKQVSSVNEKLALMLVEKQKVQSSYLETRGLLLEEKDKKDELQEEINLLAIQLRNLTISREEEMAGKKRILRQLEEKVEDNAVVKICKKQGDCSVLLQLMQKTEMITQLQSKIDLVKTSMKQIIENNKFNNRQLIQ